MDKKILLTKLLKYFGVEEIPDSLAEMRELYDSLVETSDKVVCDDYLETEDKYLRLELTNRKLIDGEKYPCINDMLNSHYINGNRIAVYKGNFLDVYTDVVINPVNNSFTYNKSLKVSKKVFHNAGMRLRRKCLDLSGDGLSTGDVLITRAYNLLSDFIIHVILPSDKGKKKIELGISYFNVYECANNNVAKIIVVPLLEFKKYGLTREEGMEISIYETMKYLANEKCLFEKVIFCVDNNKEYQELLNVLENYKTKKSP